MKSVICPTVTAVDMDDYNQQIKRLSEFAKRVHIDLMDGEFAPTKSPGLKDIWWPAKFEVDIHIMYQNPMEYLEEIIRLQPSLVIVHAEANLNHMHFAAALHKENINAGISVLPDTSIEKIESILHSFDHLLIFSGDLGHFGGEVNLDLLKKVDQAKQLHPQIEIGWDGGINDQNVKQLAEGGIAVLNTGGFIQKANNAEEAYKNLNRAL